MSSIFPKPPPPPPPPPVVFFEPPPPNLAPRMKHALAGSGGNCTGAEDRPRAEEEAGAKGAGDRGDEGSTSAFYYLTAIGQRDFNFLVEIGAFHSTPKQSKFLQGGSTATKIIRALTS